MEARNLVGIGLSYRPTRLHRLAESIPWNLFLGSLKFKITASGQIFQYNVNGFSSTSDISFTGDMNRLENQFYSLKRLINIPSVKK
jgi:hypothetical protein